MMKSAELRSSAKNNSEHNFKLAYFDRLDELLIEGLEHNTDFFTLLLGRTDLKEEVLGTFVSEIYESLRKE